MLVFYESCKPGYYLQNSDCIKCPFGAKTINNIDVYGTTFNRNTGGISSCYLPAGMYTDTTGLYEIAATGTCYY